MPSANTKVEKTPSSDSADPLRQAIVIVEHKIRNLEKRKAKLDSYKDSGKALSRDLQDAVNKYDEVLQQLELSREYVKQFTAICVENDKARKKAQKREALERSVTEASKIRTVLLIQDVLLNMGTEKAREDFLAGTNGAFILTDNDLKFLDDLYSEVSPKHEGSASFATQSQKAAEHLLAIVDGKSRELAGTTCANLLALVMKIHESGYFDHPTAETVVEVVEEPEDVVQDEEVVQSQDDTTPNQIIPPHVLPQDATIATVQPVSQTAVLPLTIPNPAPIHPLLQNIVPVSQVESSLFNAQGFKPPSGNPVNSVPPTHGRNQPTTPLNEVMSRVGGNLSFFQESELEIVDIGAPSQVPPAVQAALPSTIPTRTFTNQTFKPPALGYPRAPAPNAYFVSGFPGQAPPHYPPEMIQGFANPQNVPTPPSATNNSIPMQRPGGESPNRAYPPQPQHLPTVFSGQANATSVVPSVPQPQPYPHPSANMPMPPPVTDETSTVPVSEVEGFKWAKEEWSEWSPQTAEGQTGASDVKEKEDLPRQEVAATEERLEWSAEPMTEWNECKTQTGPKPRGDRNDRPRNNNYQGSRGGNRNNFNNNRSGNRENYYNNQNGYQSRGGGTDFQRDNRDQNSYKDRADVNGTRDGGYGKGGPRRPRPERGDRPSQASRNGGSTGPRPPRGGPRGPAANNSYRQDQHTASK